MLTEQMQQWRDGELSDSEILNHLLAAQAEVVSNMRLAETIKADHRMRRMNIPPFSVTD